MTKLRAEMDARRDRDVAQIRSLLTADQRKQFDANVAEMKQHAPRPGDDFGSRRDHGDVDGHGHEHDRGARSCARS
jgi:hypothetical protein